MAIIFKSRNNKNKKKIIISLISILAAVILIAVIMIVKSSSNLPSTGADALNPVQGFFSSINTSVSNFFSGVFSGGKLASENEDLKKQIAELELASSQLQDLQEENGKLQELLGFAEANKNADYIYAKVISKNPDNWYDLIIVNRGTRHGVYKNMCVINSEGVVGVVTETGNNWAKILTVGDSRCSVPVIVERTKVNGISNGITATSTNAGKCELSKLPYEADITPGDKIVTSGLGGVYPKGLSIGKVIEVTKIQNELQKTAVVIPSVDLEKLNYVLIIKKFQNVVDTSAEPDISPTASASK